MKTKICSGPLCLGQEKTIDQFYKNKARYDGLSGYCKKCHTHEIKPRQDALRQDVITYLGGHCVQCNWSEPKSLHIDHIDGGGRQEREVLSVSVLYKKILSGEPGYQLLCANHNMEKKFDNDEIYHVNNVAKEVEPWVNKDNAWQANATNFNNTKKGIYTKGDKWSARYDACIAHGGTDRPHQSGGLCGTCYMRWKRGKSDIGPASTNRTAGLVQND